MKAPTAFRVQVDKIGSRVLAGETSRDDALDALVRLASGNAPELIPDLVRAVFREWAGARLGEWLKARSAEVTRTPSEQLLLSLFGDVPMRIEIGPARFTSLMDANRDQLRAWQRQAQVKADNVTGFAERVGRLVAWLEPQLTDDAMTAGAVLDKAVAG